MATLNQDTDAIRKAELPVYAGSQLLSFSVNQMPAKTRIYTYVNGINLTPFTAPTTANAVIGDAIVTNNFGTAGGYLYIPSGEGKYKFLTGEILITFADSPDSIAASKYISESILYNHGLNLVDTEQAGTISLRSVEKIRTSTLGNAADKNTTQVRLDPLAQTFVVDETKNPLGIYVTGINLYVYEKDADLPIAIEMRPVVNGKPSTTEYMAGSYAIKMPSAVGVYDTVNNSATATAFTFAHPIYLKPGEYAFCVLTKSSKYKLLSAKVGDGRTVKQPFAGKLFKPQNTGEWIGDETEDLTFAIRKAKFNTGTVTFEAQTPIMSVTDYNRLRLLSTAIDFGDTASASYEIKTKAAGTLAMSEYIPIIPGTDSPMTGRQISGLEGDVKLRVTYTTKNEDVSPMIDKQLLKTIVTRNQIEAYSAEISTSELNPNGGTAGSKYVGKIVSLAKDFDSTGINVKIDVNRKIGTDIEVFCRVLSRNDKDLTNGIRDRYWVKIPLVNPTEKSFAGTSDTNYTTETYELLEPSLSYTNSANTSLGTGIVANYDTFAYYQIKVVFYASNPVYLPKIKNLVATSVL